MKQIMTKHNKHFDILIVTLQTFGNRRNTFYVSLEHYAIQKSDDKDLDRTLNNWIYDLRVIT